MNLEMRVSQLERSGRGWKLSCVLLGLTLVLITSMGQTQPAPQTIEAKKLIFRDDNGTIRMTLGAEVDKETKKSTFGLLLNNELGLQAGRFAMEENSPKLLIFGYEKDEVASAEQIIAWRNAKIGPRNEALRLRDDRDRESAKERGTASVSLSVSGLSAQSGGLRMTIVSDNGVVVQDGNLDVFRGSVTAYEEDGWKGGKAVLGRTETISKSGARTRFPAHTLTLYDAEGKVIFQAPR